MTKFLAACTTKRDRLAFECSLKLGLREKELTFGEFQTFTLKNVTYSFKTSRSSTSGQKRKEP